MPLIDATRTHMLVIFYRYRIGTANLKNSTTTVSYWNISLTPDIESPHDLTVAFGNTKRISAHRRLRLSHP